MFKETIVCLIIGVAVAFAFLKGVEKQEKVECLKWQEEAKIYDDYYITKWQDEQCRHYGIKIDAPIKKK